MKQLYPGEYVVIGGLQGLFQKSGVQAAAVSAAVPSAAYSRVDPDAAALPKQISVAQAAAS